MTTAAQAAKKQAVDAAVSIAEDITTGKLTPAQLEAQAAAETRALVGLVIGPGDPLWELHLDIMRQAVALGGMSAAEHAEWAAVLAEPVTSPEVESKSWIEQALEAGADDEDDD